MRCKEFGCPDVAVCRGWCWRHYKRWKRHGDPKKLLITERGKKKFCMFHILLNMPEPCRKIARRWMMCGQHQNLCKQLQSRFIRGLLFYIRKLEKGKVVNA